MEIRNLMNQGMSKSEISRTLGIDRKTVSKYAEAESGQSYFRTVKRTCKIDPYKDYIKQRLEQYPMLSIKRIYEEILSQGYPGKSTMVRDFIDEIKGEKEYLAVKRFETLPAQQVQVDWATMGTIIEEGQEKELYCFVMVLGFSRIRYVEFTTSMVLAVFIQCHINAFKYFGGVPKEGLYDNLKQVVITRKYPMSLSVLNPQYIDFAAYYGLKPVLCRPRKPRTKGKVENCVDYVKSNFFLGLEFTSLEDLNSKGRGWLQKVNSQIHGTTKEVPFERLKQEKPLLTDLTNKPDFKLSEVFYRKAGVDCLVPLDCSFYSVPPKFAGKELTVKKEGDGLKLFYRGELIAEHKIMPRGSISFLLVHKEELEKNCFYFPKMAGIQRRCDAKQVESIEIEVEKRKLTSYEEVL
ncbi:IS21 family transposase [Candidatus Micrarchaeota archaeon]|nr:IS21 family transposase [Candidatus Micrarchaeota archaeon]